MRIHLSVPLCAGVLIILHYLHYLYKPRQFLHFTFLCPPELFSSKYIFQHSSPRPVPVRDSPQLHKEVVTFSKRLGEMWDCGLDGAVSGWGQRHDEKWGGWHYAAVQTMKPSNQNQTCLRLYRDQDLFWYFLQQTLDIWRIELQY